MSEPVNVTERQAKYFAAMRASLEGATGRSLTEWIAIARTCPETARRARLAWFKREHGLLQNRAAYVLTEAFGGSSAWTDPAALIAALWAKPGPRAIFGAVDALASALPGVTRTARKAYTAWSREYQFAAARPLAEGGIMLGLALPAAHASMLEAASRDPWSERLKSRLRLADITAARVAAPKLLKAAWEGS
ncbi:MAG TPA: DUF4287 domain-containing protein [Caulobacteraceae bacterium]|jgi:hypothetical protein|nr:DUF4287 domain-containing protein [Caulobacteraceae bacterium]